LVMTFRRGKKKKKGNGDPEKKGRSTWSHCGKKKGKARCPLVSEEGREEKRKGPAFQAFVEEEKGEKHVCVEGKKRKSPVP